MEQIEAEQTPEQELCEILKVDEPEINQSEEADEKINVDQPEIKPVDSEIKEKQSPKKPKGVKTRADLIEKIKESSEVVGNQVEIKGMRLHRRRRNSLENILREQVQMAVEQHAEKTCGIPQENDQRLSYAVDMLYNFDMLVCKGLEKACEFTNLIPVEVTGLSETIDNDPRIRNEVKRGFEDWIKESPGLQGWVDQAASPSTRILLCHLYPLMACMKLKDKNKKARPIPMNLKMHAGIAKMRSVVDPPVVKKV